jgi:hypothetical protein
MKGMLPRENVSRHWILRVGSEASSGGELSHSVVILFTIESLIVALEKVL